VYDGLFRREFLHSIILLALTASLRRDIRGGLEATLLVGSSTFGTLLRGPFGDRKVVEDLDCSVKLFLNVRVVFQ